MSASNYLLQLPTPGARVLQDGTDSLVVIAESTGDAKAMAQNLLGAAVWNGASAGALAADASMTGWRFRIRLTDAAGVEQVDVTVTADGESEGVDFATGVLTSSANYSDTETVTINGKVYTFQSSLTNVDGHVKIGASEALSLANLHHAINGSGGISGTDYAAATTANPDVTAVDNAAHTVTVTAKVAGTGGNAITTTETSATAAWGAATLTGGANSIDKLSSLAELMVTALNATSYISGAAFNDSTHVLTVASAADAKGDNNVVAEVYPPQADSPSPVGVSTRQGVAIPGFVSSVSDGGSSGSAVTVTLVADTYTVPTIAVKARTE